MTSAETTYTVVEIVLGKHNNNTKHRKLYEMLVPPYDIVWIQPYKSTYYRK